MALLLRFNQLRNSIWSSCPARLLMPHAGLSSGKLLDPKSYERRLFSTRVQETASLDRTCISRIQPLEFQQTSEHEKSGPLLIFDIKTTDFFQKRNRITEFAVHDLWAGKNNTFETLLNPEMDVPKYIAAVTNINNDLVCRPDVPSDVLPLLLALVRSRQTPGKPVIWVAHNVKQFDGPFLDQEFDRCSAQMPEDWLFVDTLCLARKLPKLSASNDKRHLHDLGSLCKRYGISVEGPPHRAMQEFDLKLTYEGLMDEAIKASYFSKFLK
ncbi:hypothetical protein VPH35_023519 [Triticum aestivum]